MELFSDYNTAFALLLNADDQTLGRLCQQNRLYESICQSEFFWRRRSEESLSHLLRLRDRFPSWREFYLTARKPAVYAVLYGDVVKIFNTIRGAYDHLTQTLPPGVEVPPIERADELSTISTPGHVWQIYLMFDQEEINIWDLPSLNHLLLSVGSPPFYLDPNLAELPDLQSKGKFIFYYLIPPDSNNWTIDPLTRIGLSRPTSDLFKRLERDHELLFNEMVELLIVNAKYSQRDIYWYSDGRFVRNFVPAMIVDRVGEDYMMAKLPDRYYEFMMVNKSVPPFAFVDIPPIADLEWEPVEHISRYGPRGTYLVDIDPERAREALGLPPIPHDQLERLVRLLDIYNIPIEEYLGHHPVIDREGGLVGFNDLMNLAPGVIVRSNGVPRFDNPEDYARHNILFLGYDANGKRYVTVVSYDPTTGAIGRPIRM